MNILELIGGGVVAFICIYISLVLLNLFIMAVESFKIARKLVSKVSFADINFFAEWWFAFTNPAFASRFAEDESIK